ncbi:hypothetical protein AAFF_G00408640 [Aldrovandia affinis]|uniref:Uncharacterized protein n=1 Tax=Aldrovandia affinis TaxID=143900 RepID=A0AAD7SBX1_9TELE|nr:hypothetical protein AAFF_G00408640 [Aldrovandia affinis]
MLKFPIKLLISFTRWLGASTPGHWGPRKCGAAFAQVQCGLTNGCRGAIISALTLLPSYCGATFLTAGGRMAGHSRMALAAHFPTNKEPNLEHHSTRPQRRDMTADLRGSGGDALAPRGPLPYLSTAPLPLVQTVAALHL